MLKTRGASERRHQLTHAAMRVFAKKGMNFQRRARRWDGETIFSPRPHGRAIAEQHRFEIEAWAIGFQLEFCRAAIPPKGFDIGVPILIRPKRDSAAVLGINDSNELPVRGHDRIETISSRSSRAISLRLPARTFAG